MMLVLALCKYLLSSCWIHTKNYRLFSFHLQKFSMYLPRLFGLLPTPSRFSLLTTIVLHCITWFDSTTCLTLTGWESPLGAQIVLQLLHSTTNFSDYIINSCRTFYLYCFSSRFPFSFFFPTAQKIANFMYVYIHFFLQIITFLKHFWIFNWKN